jgi:hypothetical protein
MFIDADEAQAVARQEIESAAWQRDAMFQPWRQSSLGSPVLVCTVHREPSYWLVPVMIEGRAAGFVRVLGTGRVAAMGVHYRDVKHIPACPVVVTGITAEEASRKVRSEVHLTPGETSGDPVFVHDGPPGREAWLVETYREGRPARWIFVTPAFIYERPAGELLREDLE